MKLTHKNFWKMLIDTLAFFFKDPKKWDEVVVLKKNVEKAKALEAEIALWDKRQKEKDPTAYTSEKDKQLDLVQELSYKLGCKISSYAIEVKDLVLEALVNLSRYQLEEGTEAEIIARCQIIADKGTEFLSKLTDYKVTAPEIKTLNDAIDLYKKMPAERDLVANERKTAVRSISVVIPEARKLLKTIDVNVDGLIDDETFIAEYHEIRSIYSRKLPSSKKKNGNNTPTK